MGQMSWVSRVFGFSIGSQKLMIYGPMAYCELFGGNEITLLDPPIIILSYRVHKDVNSV